MKNKFFVLALLCGALNYAQQLPEVIPPSPETAALFKYQEYPVDYSTGLAQINIPLFEIKSGDLSVPISISYHAAGCKVDERDGPIAKGWSLNTGAVVSRTIHGSVDFGGGSQENFPFPSPFITNNINPNNDLNDLAYAESIMHYFGNLDLVNASDFIDSEYDIFSYNIGNNSGKLIFKDENNIKTPVLIPPKPFQVNPTVINSALSKLTFLDDKGVSYEFGPGESNSFGSTRGTTAFKIDKITSRNKSHSINYFYQGDFQNRISINQQITVEDDYFPIQTPSYNLPSDPETITSSNGYQTSRISEIIYENGRAVFNLLEGANGNETRVESIDIFELNNTVQPIRTIKFHRTRLHWLPFQQVETNVLDSITFHDRLGKQIQSYSFEHYPTPYVDTSSTETNLNFRYVDWWGYYNGSGETDMIPEHTNVNVLPSTATLSVGNSQADREPNLNTLKSGVLKKIKYPTGGTTEFIYENNEYSSATGSIKDGPGLRIAQTINEDGYGDVVKRTFKYGTNELGVGFVDLQPNLNYMKDENLHLDFVSGLAQYIHTRNRKRTYYSSFAPQLSEVAQRPLRYTQITEYKGTVNENIGKTVYEYDRIPWGGRPIGPSKWDIPSYNHWNTSVLKKKTEYVRVENGAQITYEPRTEMVNGYTTNELDVVKGLHIQRRIITSGGRVNDANYPYYPESYIVSGGPLQLTPGNNNRSIYSYREYGIPVGTKNLTLTTETLFNDDGSEISNVTNYEYNSDQLISRITKNRNDIIYETAIKYAPEFAYSTTTIVQNPDGSFNEIENPNLYQKMKTDNLIAFEVEKTNEINGILATSVVSTYKQKPIQNNSDVIFVNEDIFTLNIKGIADYDEVDVDSFSGGQLVLDSRLEKRYSIEKYDQYGNILELSNEFGPKICYLWGYNGEYPIAKIENASFAQIALTLGVSEQILEEFNESDLAEIDGLRTGLPNAMITTYTYRPLFGLTSMTDPRGYITSYNYDDFNRLKEIKDADNLLLEDYQYHYKTQQ